MARGTKFGCLCADIYPLDDVPHEPVDIGGGFWASRKMPEIDLETWKDYLGKIEIEHVVNAGLWVWTEIETDEVNTGNEENAALNKKLSDFWWCIFLHEPPSVENARISTGSVRDGKWDFTDTSKLVKVYNHQSNRTRMNLDTLREIATTSSAYAEFRSAGILGGRFGIGLKTIWVGVLSQFVEDGHLTFQRALEGIFHPKSAEKFKKRGATVFYDRSRSDGDPVDLLEQVYDMRSELTHCKLLKHVFPDLEKEEADRRGIEIRDATYTMAVRTYRAVLRDRNLVELFSQEGIGDYWGKVVEGKKEPPFVVELFPEDWKTP